MALSRCEKCGEPKGRNGRIYVGFVEPINFPKTSTICGRSNCENSGLIWLTIEEMKKYDKGQRIFLFSSSVTKVKVI